MASSTPRSTSSKFASLVTSVFDLHVRIALQEADREKRRLIVGGLVITTALVLLSGALLVGHGALALWLVQSWKLSWLAAFLIIGAADLLLAGLLLRIGGQLLKG
ncbi:phage holin family protein, partial [Synechococcus sp. Cruz CV12-2-Slac-r]